MVGLRLDSARTVAVAMVVAMAVASGCTTQQKAETKAAGAKVAEAAKADSLRAGLVTTDGVRVDAVQRDSSATGAVADFSGRRYFDAGELQMRQGRPGAAIDEYLRAVQSADAPAAAWIRLGNAYAQMGRWAEAIPAWEEALRREPEGAVAVKVREDIEGARRKMAESRAKPS